MRTRFDWRNLTSAGRNGAYRDAQYSPALGASVWETCPQLAALDPAVGFGLFEDFVYTPLDIAGGVLAGIIVTGDHKTITLDKAAGGVLTMACGNTDNDEFYLQMAATATHAPFVITDASGKPLWFSARVKAVQHADASWFVGMAEENMAADSMADNTGVLADKDFIGFNIIAASPAAWDIVWRKNGQVQQRAAAVAVNADDYHTFGFVFDGGSTVYFYVDGVVSATTATTSAATFPSAQNLSPFFGVKTGEGVDKSLSIDYVKVFQVR
jgi:hypothetical protein